MQIRRKHNIKLISSAPFPRPARVPHHPRCPHHAATLDRITSGQQLPRRISKATVMPNADYDRLLGIWLDNWATGAIHGDLITCTHVISFADKTKLISKYKLRFYSAIQSFEYTVRWASGDPTDRLIAFAELMVLIRLDFPLFDDWIVDAYDRFYRQANSGDEIVLAANK